MKRAIAILLVIMMVLSLAACGGGSTTTETPAATETIENTLTPATTENQFDVDNAIVETPKHIYEDVQENQARVMQNTYIIKVTVGTITDRYFEGGDNTVTLSTTYLAAFNVRVFLPIEELALLEKGKPVAVIGKVTDVQTGNVAYGNPTMLIFEDAQLYEGEVSEVPPRENEIFTGILKGKNNSYEGYWNIKIGDSNVYKLISFAEGEDLSALSDDTEITFTAFMLGGAYNNARIIKD